MQRADTRGIGVDTSLLFVTALMRLIPRKTRRIALLRTEAANSDR